ncbi:hypothetical protein N7481_003479 [Penicillium waksmanii]|uniref:uncharacterized protein n=1 Tax=Penicillium waksmanii TaxID=69791 RepID=UPI0025493BF7|nr:uncharacterized protein N7481_003479 [Penicillium waksmanii]KAJ5988269.1 hypothetical protein N7481_003479 [Penicillium waksmanii]
MSKEDKHCTAIDFASYKELIANRPRQTPLSGQPERLDKPVQPGANSSPQVSKPLPSRGEHSRKVVSGGPKDFGLPQLCEESEYRRLIVRKESPWDTFRRTLRCNLAGDVFIVARRSRPSQVVAIREYTQGDVNKMLRWYEILDHDNLLSARECFVDGGSMFALVDDLPLTLEQLVGCRTMFPTEAELASMVWQILNGLCYLSSKSLEHQSLTCRNILLGLDGVVKIASLEMCMESQPGEIQRVYIKALSSITMETMQKYVKDDGVVGVDDVDRWPVDSDAFEFLSALSTAKSIESLKEQPLVRKKDRLLGELALLARSVLLSARMFYSYEK